MFEQAVQALLGDWLPAFFNPQKRLFWGYLLTALVIAMLWLCFRQGQGVSQALRKIFNRQTWLSASARADYLLAIINAGVMSLLAPRLLSQAAIAYLIFEGMHELMYGRALIDAPGWVIVGSFTLCLFVVDDFARYWVHRLLHRIPVLWAFHRVHHSATALNPVTVLRTHPVEGVIFALRSAVVQGICIGMFFFFFGDRLSLMTVLGAGVFNFTFNLLGSNLRHSSIAIGYWKPVEKIFMSPAQHQIHHSVAMEHHDRNFGVALSIWDSWFGTLHHSEPGQDLVYGLNNVGNKPHSLISLYGSPFVEAMKILAKPFAGIGTAPVFRQVILGLVVAGSLLASASAVYAEDKVVNIYSARKEALILPLLERFRDQTGIDFRLVTGKADGLLKRLEIEGQASPADVFITVDAGRLQRAKDAGILQPIDNAVLNKTIPPELRDRENYWFGLSQRARVIFYARDRVDPASLSTYEALADPQWEKRLCIRSSGNIYNQSLVASMIEANGVEATEKWARGLVANFARRPGGGDTDQLLATAAGQCDIALVNTYYFGRLAGSDKAKDREIAAELAVFWPNQDDRGAHVNVSGAGITKHARHREAAEKLLEFLVNPESQAWYAEVNNEYPVVPGAQISETLESFGEFKADSLNLTTLGENNRAAVELMDRAGWR